MKEKEILLAVITGVTANPSYTHFSEETIANTAIRIADKIIEKLQQNEVLPKKQKQDTDKAR